LSMLMADCIELRSDIMKGKLRERPLLNLIKAYHDCTAADLSVYKKEKAWIQFTGGIATGLNFSKLKYKSQYSGYEHLVGSYESSSSFAAGITFDVSSPRLSERLSFTTSILSVSSEYSRTSESYRYPAFYKNEISIKINQVKIPIGIKYTFAERKFTPFINTGISGAFHTRSDGNWDETVQPFNTTPTVNNYKLVLKRNQLGLWAGAGVIVSVMPKLKCWLEVRYEATNGIAPFLVDLDDLRSNISNIQFLIGLKLN